MIRQYSKSTLCVAKFPLTNHRERQSTYKPINQSTSHSYDWKLLYDSMDYKIII